MSNGPVHDSYVQANGVRLHYYDWGGDGQPVVLLHATGLHAMCYRPIAVALTAAGRVFTYDQRGHGDSGGASDGRYDWYATMEDLAGFITAMKLGAVRGVGHSSGATAVGSLSHDQPELISKAVLCEPVLFMQAGGPEMGWRSPFIDATLKRRREFDSVEAMFNNFTNKPPYVKWQKEMLRDYCEFGSRPNSAGKRELKCAPEIEAKFYETSREFNGMENILRSDVPMLVLLGNRPDALGAAISEALHEGIRNGNVMDLPGGHFLPQENPADVTRLALDFFRA